MKKTYTRSDGTRWMRIPSTDKHGNKLFIHVYKGKEK